MDMDRKGCTLEKVASLVKVREGPSCPFCLAFLTGLPDYATAPYEIGIDRDQLGNTFL